MLVFLLCNPFYLVSHCGFNCYELALYNNKIVSMLLSKLASELGSKSLSKSVSKLVSKLVRKFVSKYQAS